MVVAGGRGARAGLGRNKVFFAWKGRSVLSRCLDALERSGALDGAVLPGGKIKKGKLRGVPSYGMLCSKNELLVEMNPDDENGIWILWLVSRCLPSAIIMPSTMMRRRRRSTRPSTPRIIITMFLR